ncbi:glycosyltransferase [Niveispirillum sp. SYP-B3756]|uniref:glycosyltransferase n=1 Tax=Niveispirillum sp. SYP-B3756 TaxID=2662178 RepID=UPI00129231F9|nr:glycosyltransferase [Niveispirillum sp. SYP-B3756]MQP64902.1 glycosyltransferase [Niveispirillum sp. SYP-B3756]
MNDMTSLSNEDDAMTPVGEEFSSSPKVSTEKPAHAPRFWEAQDFDEEAYLAAYPDIAEAVAAGTVVSAYQHWLHHGQHEIEAGLRPPFTTAPPVVDTTLAPSVYSDFDEYGYVHLNPDVASVPSPVEHWLNHGRFEARVAPGIRPFADRSLDMNRLLQHPFGVNFFAPLSAKSGLGTAARGYMQALGAVNVPFNSLSLDISRYGDASKSPIRLPSWNGQYRVNIIQQNCDMLTNMARIYGRNILDDHYNIGIWAWELAAFRPDWLQEFGALDEVWALSNFCAESISTLSPVPVRAMPLVVELDTPNPTYDRAYFGLPEDAYIFSFIFDVSSVMDRKNPLALVQAFKKAFGNDPKVHLLLKYHSGNADRSRVTKLYSVARASNIRLMSEKMTDAQITGLKQCCDCFVSPHRSEGFGLNIAEMMYLGKPVIATGYSGNMDFMSKDNSYLIDYDLTEIDQNLGPYLKGFIWAEPSIDHMAQLMRHVYENRDDAALKAAQAARDVRTRNSQQAVGLQIEGRLKELGLQQEPPPFVRNWGRSVDAVWKLPISSIKGKPWEARVNNLLLKPTISLIVPVYNVPGEYLRKCIESVIAQYYPNWELCLCDDGSTSADTLAVLEEYQGKDGRIIIRHLPKNLGISGASNAAVEVATGEYLALLDNDDELPPMALLRVVETINARPSVDYIYTDEDKINEKGEHVDDYCKPDWSPEHLESVMYLLHLQVIRKSLFLKLGGFRAEYTGAQDFDLALRISQSTTEIVHIPEILYHWRMIPGSAAAAIDAKPKALQNAFRALEDHVRIRYGGSAKVEHGKLTGFFRVRHDLVGKPPVTIMIPTDNRLVMVEGRGEFNMIDNLITSIKAKTTYPNYRILVVDNGNLTAQQRERYERTGIQIASYKGPRSPFNFSAKANFGFRQVKTEHLVMLNDDMEIITPDWLEALLEFSHSPEIGVVGAKLLYPDSTIQHAGVVLGVNGNSAHMYHGFPGDFVGYNGYTHTIRNYTVLTGACMATRKSVIDELGGFDEAFAIDYNDIDFCLKAVEAGYRNVYTPFCELFHFEGKTSVRTAQNPAEVELFSQRWGRYVARDPHHNPNFAPDRIDYALRQPLNDLLKQQDPYSNG